MNHFHLTDFEESFSKDFNYGTQNNQESILTVGNGRYGLRGTFEERLPYEKRGFFRSGFYSNRKGHPENLLCLPDISELRLTVNDEFFHISLGKFQMHSRYLDLDLHELVRQCIWVSPAGKRYSFIFKRFFSFVDPDLFYQEVVINSEESDVEVLIEIGVDGSHSGHIDNGIIAFEPKVIDEKIMQVHVAYDHQGSRFLTFTQGLKIGDDWQRGIFEAKNNCVKGTYRVYARKGSELHLTKVVLITDDSISINEANERFIGAEDYGTHLAKHLRILQATVNQPLQIMGGSRETNQKIRASSHHIFIMTPFHDAMSIGAKGLSGDGYRGHVFWDTDMFIFPYYLFTDPGMAKKLLMYRYHRLDESRNNARSRGYQGAMVAWESALSGSDQTPEFSSIDIHSGKRVPVDSGKKELHVTADVMYSIIMYYKVTDDHEFMEKYGIEMLEEYTRFWLSKCVITDRGLEILDVIGPDEYTEHVNNNYYTNFLVRKMLEMASWYFRDRALANRAIEASERIYLPEIVNSLIPQDDTFLSKENIDIGSYRVNAGGQDILKDYSRKQVNNFQVLKQADTILLFELFPDDFPEEVVSTTFRYYEKRTIHDSSLSKSTHAIVGFDIGDEKMATGYFRESLDIDFSDDSYSSIGIHAASMYRPFVILFRGVLGIRVMKDGILKIDPRLQTLIPNFSLTFQFRKQTIKITYDKNVCLRLIKGDNLEIIIGGEKHNLTVNQEYVRKLK